MTVTTLPRPVTETSAPEAAGAVPAVPAFQAACVPQLVRAQSGEMPINELLDFAGRWQEQRLMAEAAEIYRLWIAHTDSPVKYVACFNHGTVLAAQNRLPEAEAAYQLALTLSPHFPQAKLNLGHALERRGAHEEAQAQWQGVLEDTQDGGADALPLRLHALNNLARLNETLRRFDVAERYMCDSLSLKPDQFDVLQHYVHIRQKQCEWPLYKTVGEVTQNQLLVGTSALAMLSASDDPVLQLMAAQRFVHERLPAPPAKAMHIGFPPRTGKVKIGYLSGDLHMHAVGLLTAELLDLHDHERFETFAFSWSRDDGTPLRARLVKSFDHYYRIGGVDDHTAARMIASCGIDVLVDLQGLTNGARANILAQRPAPIQVSYLGFPGTCALPGVDWILADRFVMPEALRPFHTEKPIYLPNCYQVSDRQREIGKMPTRAQYELPEDAFVFCSFNNNFKFTEPVFAAWMHILHEVPNSVLWLLADNEWARENMLRQADAAGVARKRLIFAPRVAPPDYLARFQLADLMLDTFPYNAGTTASDALWMGLPILTCSGRSYISRMAGSLLTAVGLPDLITESIADYEKLAIQLGRNPKRVASYKRYLAEHGRSSALFDMPQIVRDIEDAFETMALAQRAHG
ncbi:acetylglucosamine transferase [Ideonella azotifigens]|uniref:O-linked N-acetylglucosamine transferase family protein n=2 Tax=Ideonella azotifigens TaxID=513160 RepID=UPI0011451076